MISSILSTTSPALKAGHSTIRYFWNSRWVTFTPYIGDQDLTVYIPNIGAQSAFEAVLGSNKKNYVTWSSWPPF